MPAKLRLRSKRVRHHKESRRHPPTKPPEYLSRQRTRSKRNRESRLIPISGKRPVEELLRRNIQPERLLVTAREKRGKEDELLRRCRLAGWKIEESERVHLDEASEGLHHQGYVALIREFPFWSLEGLIETAQQGKNDPILVALDQIQDVGNLGAILRSAECAGVSGAIVPRHQSAGITAAVIRSSAGAALHLPMCRVVNLSGALDELREAGYRVFGADQEGTLPIFKADLHDPVVIVIGSEGRGLRPGVKRRCDALVNIPLLGRVGSLNASAAAAVCLFEVVRQRMV